jgi:hypothetical protein
MHFFMHSSPPLPPARSPSSSPSPAQLATSDMSGQQQPPSRPGSSHGGRAVAPHTVYVQPPQGPAYTLTYHQRPNQEMQELSTSLISAQQVQRTPQVQQVQQGGQGATYQLVHSSQMHGQQSNLRQVVIDQSGAMAQGPQAGQLRQVMLAQPGQPQAAPGMRQVIMDQIGQVLVPVTLAPHGSIVAQRTQQLLPVPEQQYYTNAPQQQGQGQRMLVQVMPHSGRQPQAYIQQPQPMVQYMGPAKMATSVPVGTANKGPYQMMAVGKMSSSGVATQQCVQLGPAPGTRLVRITSDPHAAQAGYATSSRAGPRWMVSSGMELHGMPAAPPGLRPRAPGTPVVVTGTTP